MWKLLPADLSQFQGAGGERFVHFVDRLIRAQAARGGLPQSEIKTQLRTNIPDGGVDTEIRRAIPTDPIGWFGVPTCWQFKAEYAASIDDKPKKTKKNDLQTEINKWYATELIKQGYGYRLCILGDLSPSKVTNWEAQLKAEVQTINPTAPEPRVIHAGDLLSWAERSPAVIGWLRDVASGVFHLETWGRNCRGLTRNYVPNPPWEPVQRLIAGHVNFGAKCIGGDPCLTIGGAAGVGKTRLVFEALDKLPEAASLVLYAADEQEAKKVATSIVNTEHAVAVVVADECSSQTRFFLNENLRGHTDRVRVIAIDNSGQVGPTTTHLSPDQLKNTDAILEANFPEVPGDRRHQYAALSKGFVRLAADMCQRDNELRTGELSGLLSSIEQYVRNRLGQERIPLISLLALFNKIGFKDDVQADLAALCEIARVSRQDFYNLVREIKDSPGFVVQAGRYWYVSPEIVARALFAEGWQRWVSHDLAGFLGRLPADLKQQFIDRAGRMGGKEVSDQLGAFFRHWFEQLSAEQLVEPTITSLVESVVESSPSEYLPKLRTILEDATAETLFAINGYELGSGWGPRRTLVWLLERLAAFPEYFENCEAGLFQLALHESELRIGNNATAVWRNLFCVYLSGTAAPYLDRLRVLRKRLTSKQPNGVEVAFQGLDSALGEASAHIVGPPVVAGRLRPSNWQPGSRQEENACYRAALALCAEQFNTSEIHHRFAFGVLLSNLSALLYRGLLDDISKIVSRDKLRDQELPVLLKSVDHFLEIEQASDRASKNERAAEYLQKVSDWINTFRPTDFAGRLRSVCARDPWDQRFSTDPRSQSDETDDLALEIIAEPPRLHPHLDWLTSAGAPAAERLAFALGRHDESFALGPMIFEHAIACAVAPLVRGYVRGLVFSERRPNATLISLTDRLADAQPQIAVDVLSYGGDSLDGLNRAVRLVESGKLSPKYLATFAMGTGRRQLTETEVRCILGILASAAAASDMDSGEAGIRFLAQILRVEKRKMEHKYFDAEGTRADAWRLLEATTAVTDHYTAHEWGEVLSRLGAHDPLRAASLLGQILLGDNYDLERIAEEKLAELAVTQPAAVMSSVGAAMLDPERGWILQVRTLRDLVSKIPLEVVVEWLRKHGISAARALARHLPRPYVDDTGHPVVPTLLNTVFTMFDDVEVLDNFVAGGHSGEMWWGDGSERFRQEAETAKRFLTYPNRRIREWARHEIAERLSMAEYEERQHAERLLPS